MKTYVSERLLDPNNTSISAANVGSAINDAIRYWKMRRFWFNTADTTVTLVQGDSEIYLTSITDFLVELPMDDGFVIEYSGIRYPLYKRNPRDFDDVYLTNGVGLPFIYTVKSGRYFSYYIPDQDYKLRVWYMKDYENLVNTDDTNDFTVNAERMIELWAIANLIAEFRQDKEMEPYYRNAAQNEYTNCLGVRNAKVNSSGHLTLHSYL